MDQPAVTQLLEHIAEGDRGAADRLFAVLYEELKKMAAMQMNQDVKGHTLQATALVHESWVKLIGGRDSPNWKNRQHFFSAAAQAMRRILVDSARARRALKRGADGKKFDLRDTDLAWEDDLELLALDDAMEELREAYPEKSQLVELKYFAGLTNAQVAEQLGVSVATVERHWSFARAWLKLKLNGR